LILISGWNKRFIEKNFHCHHEYIHYVGNGVNFNDFPIMADCKKDGKTILVEGWESTNPTKDVDAIGPTVAQMLREDGYRILAYSQMPLERFPDTPHEYYFRPSIERLNQLYERATVLIKASKYDARACAPMEAMTKGTVTVRAISLGDDDLINDKNCIRVPYCNEVDLYREVKALLNDNEKLTRLKNNCLEYVQKYSWDYWMPQIERILVNG
jgi:glycosyltransferase involved in cell wall biosynthesis